MAALHMNKVCPCMHDGCKGFTGFVRFHPFKEGFEVRKCFTCKRNTAQDARVCPEIKQPVRKFPTLRRRP